MLIKFSKNFDHRQRIRIEFRVSSGPVNKFCSAIKSYTSILSTASVRNRILTTVRLSGQEFDYRLSIYAGNLVSSGHVTEFFSITWLINGVFSTVRASEKNFDYRHLSFFRIVRSCNNVL